VYPRKGAIAVRSDGDLVVVDPNAETVIEKENLYAKHPLTPFEGWRLKGKIAYTILRGMVIAKDGRVVVEEPRGTWIPRSTESLSG